MSFTGILGNSNSQSGNILLGVADADQTVQSVHQVIGFQHTAGVSSSRPQVTVPDSLGLSHNATASVDRLVSASHALAFGHSAYPGFNNWPGSGMAFTGVLGTEASQPGNLVLGIAGTDPLSQLVSQVLAFSQSAEPGARRDSSDVLSLGQVASVIVARPISISQTLSLMQVVDRGIAASAADTLSLIDSATVLRVVQGSASDSLALVQSTHANITNVTVSQSLALIQTADVRAPIYLRVNQNLNISQNEEGHAGVVTKGVSDVLAFTDSAGLTYFASVSQTLSFTQDGERKNIIVDQLNLIQIALAAKGGVGNDTLALVQTLGMQGIFSRSIADILGLKQAVAYYIEGLCTRQQYSPFIGASTDSSYTPPSLTPPTIGSHKLTLTYPYVSPTTTLVLRNPQFGDKDRLNFNRINRSTRGGTLIVFADPKWPKTQALAVQVDGLTQAQASDMIAFLRQSLGQEIGLLDWENRQWRGVITTPDAQVTHVNKNDRSVAFEFQGTLT